MIKLRGMLTREAMYVSRNIGAGSHDHCSHGNATMGSLYCCATYIAANNMKHT